MCFESLSVECGCFVQVQYLYVGDTWFSSLQEGERRLWIGEFMEGCRFGVMEEARRKGEAAACSSFVYFPCKVMMGLISVRSIPLITINGVFKFF